ncbi:MAG: 4Fe-4S dicluster domain-containing protein, partial [Candidatus Heimdallarchaeota archaeon]
LSKHGIAKEITKKEAFEIIDRVIDLGLVQIGDNVQNKVNWICNCCGCCCEAIVAYKRLGYSPKIQSNFQPEVLLDRCNGCGVCVKKCPLDAIALVVDESDKKHAEIDLDRCFGCGVCAHNCNKEAIQMNRLENVRFTPEDSFERGVRMAIDTGRLQNLLFDNQHLWSHKMLQRFIGTLLNLGPIRRIMADDQLKSRFMKLARKMQKNQNKKIDL